MLLSFVQATDIADLFHRTLMFDDETYKGHLLDVLDDYLTDDEELRTSINGLTEDEAKVFVERIYLSLYRTPNGKAIDDEYPREGENYKLIFRMMDVGFADYFCSEKYKSRVKRI